MRVLVTRPLHDARETEAFLKARGHEAIVAPLLIVNFHDGPQLDLAGVQAILSTSANGVRALSRRTPRRDVPLLAVGPQTAVVAREAGFTTVRSADGDADALARTVVASLSTANGTLLHASGVEGEGRLANSLAAAGYIVRTATLYNVASVADLPSSARDALTDGTLDAALLFSPRSARIFAECVVKSGLSSAVSGLVAVCISEAAATALASRTFRDVRVAKHPNQTSLLDCLG